MPTQAFYRARARDRDLEGVRKQDRIRQRKAQARRKAGIPPDPIKQANRMKRSQPVMPAPAEIFVIKAQDEGISPSRDISRHRDIGTATPFPLHVPQLRPSASYASRLPPHGGFADSALARAEPSSSTHSVVTAGKENARGALYPRTQFFSPHSGSDRQNLPANPNTHLTLPVSHDPVATPPAGKKTALGSVSVAASLTRPDPYSKVEVSQIATRGDFAGTILDSVPTSVDHTGAAFSGTSLAGELLLLREACARGDFEKCREHARRILVQSRHSRADLLAYMRKHTAR